MSNVEMRAQVQWSIASTNLIFMVIHLQLKHVKLQQTDGVIL
jgi:hypothetical protein